MKYLILILLLTGCSSDVDLARDKRRGDARLVVFTECMKLAAANARKADDDVSDIVSECTSSSYYMTNYIQ